MGQSVERREFLKQGLGFFIAVNLPQFNPSPFPWKREEILFGPNAGFEEARLGGSIGVWADLELYNLDLAEAIKPWNVMVHQLGRDNLFHLEYDSAKIMVYFLPNQINSKTYVKPSPSYTNPYEYCEVLCQLDIRTYTAKHELGHTLGLVDFVVRNTDTNAFPHVNPQKCYIQDKPIKSIMSYCDLSNKNCWICLKIIYTHLDDVQF